MQEEKTQEVKQKKEKKNKENTELIQLKTDNAELTDKILRLNAEIQNINRRNQEQLQNMLKFEGEDLIKDLLNVVDNFERAINMDDDNLEDEVSKFLSGFKMIYTNLLGFLNKNSVTAIECLGTEFNSDYMEAVMTEKKEGTNPNVVIEVLQKGYMYKDKCIRYAMVRVSE